MGVVEDFEKLWYTHECTLLRGAGESPYGGSVGEPVPFKGRVSQVTRRVATATGEELVTDTTVQCPLGLVVEVGDQIELPEPFAGVWEVSQRSAHEGVQDMHPNHQKLTLSAEGADTSDPEPDSPYGGSPYG